MRPISVSHFTILRIVKIKNVPGGRKLRSRGFGSIIGKKIRDQRKKKIHLHWMWLNEQFHNVGELIKVEEIGFHMNLNQETLKVEFAHMKCCFPGTNERFFCIVWSLMMKNDSTMITQREQIPRGHVALTTNLKRPLFNLVLFFNIVIL